MVKLCLVALVGLGCGAEPARPAMSADVLTARDTLLLAKRPAVGLYWLAGHNLVAGAVVPVTLDPHERRIRVRFMTPAPPPTAAMIEHDGGRYATGGAAVFDDVDGDGRFSLRPGIRYPDVLPVDRLLATSGQDRLLYVESPTVHGSYRVSGVRTDAIHRLERGLHGVLLECDAVSMTRATVSEFVAVGKDPVERDPMDSPLDRCGDAL
jgi:hypothetical protein